MKRRTKTRLGRPPFPEGEAKAVMFCVRLTAEERVAMEGAARRAELSASEWARRAIVNSLRPELPDR